MSNNIRMSERELLDNLWQRVKAYCEGLQEEIDDYAAHTKLSDFINDGDGTSPFATEAYVDEYGGKIDEITVGGVALPIVDKSVEIPIPIPITDTEIDAIVDLPREGVLTQFRYAAFASDRGLVPGAAEVSLALEDWDFAATATDAAPAVVVAVAAWDGTLLDYTTDVTEG